MLGKSNESKIDEIVDCSDQGSNIGKVIYGVCFLLQILGHIYKNMVTFTKTRAHFLAVAAFRHSLQRVLDPS